MARSGVRLAAGEIERTFAAIHARASGCRHRGWARRDIAAGKWITAPIAHLYLWVPNALLAEGLNVMAAWGFTYKSNIVWHKVGKDGGSDGRYPVIDMFARAVP